MTSYLLIAALVAAPAFAAPIRLSDECKKKLGDQAIELETKKLDADKEVLASALEAHVSAGFRPDIPTMNVYVRLVDPKDGRAVSYTSTPLKKDVPDCNINIVRKDESYCRYSANDGPKSLNKIEGVRFKKGYPIKPNTRVGPLEDKQIRALVQPEDKNQPIKDVIKETGYSQIDTGTLNLPDGRVLTYMEEDAGGNPVGAFFKDGTDEQVGQNGDGDICIK